VPESASACQLISRSYTIGNDLVDLYKLGTKALQAGGRRESGREAGERQTGERQTGVVHITEHPTSLVEAGC
jgi:hypothetical protein